jgi:hypothetical protein
MLTHEELKNHPGNAENLGLRADYYLNRPPFLRWNRPGSRQIIKILIKNYFRYGHPNPYSEKHKEKLRLLPRSVNIDEVFEKKLQASALYKGQFEKIFGKLENASANFKKFHQKSAPDPRLSEFFWELLDR